MNYREEWQMYAEAELPGFDEHKLTSLISAQTSQTANQLTRYLWFDLALKGAALATLFLAIILLSPNLNIIPLVVVGLIGILLSYYQYRVMRKQPDYDYTQPTLVLLSSVLKTTRLHLNRLALLVGASNPLIILGGSYLYLYHKYGDSLSRSNEDITVTLGLMFIGFLINFITFSIQQNSMLNDLEISQNALVNEDNTGLKEIVGRRKRRLAIYLTLIIIGFILFLLILSGYVMMT